MRAVHFQGNQTFSSDELSARVLTTPSSLTRRYLRVIGTRRCYPDIGLANDVANLRNYYRNFGFYDTRVDTVVTTISPKRVDVTFRITEGQPLILDSLAITGLDSLPDRNVILRDTLLKVGQRVGLLLVAAQIDTITSRLRNAGYAKAQPPFQAFDIHPTEHRAELTLDAQPGMRARFGAVAITSIGARGGAPSVADSVVKKLLGLRPGQLYSDEALAQSRRNLYNLSLFRYVDVAVDTNWAHGDSVADVAVVLREDYMKQFDLEEGWGQLDCFRLSALYTDKNFQEQARRFEFTARLSKLGYAEKARSSFTKNLCYRPYLDQDSLASSKVNDYFGATIRWPTVTVARFTPSLSMYTAREGQYQAYLRTTDVGFGVSATRNISRATPLRIGYNLEHGATQGEPVILCAIFSRCTIDEQADVQLRRALGVASVALSRTTTDNPVVPTRGYTTSIETRYSAPFLISDPTLKFFKVTADAAWYRQLLPRTVFAARARGGLIAGGQNIGGATLPPPQERLYAGGPTTVRGFQQNQLGPQVYLLGQGSRDSIKVTDSSFYLVAKPGARQDRSIPSGGNLLAVLNAELRIRDPFFPDLLEYAPFVDAGQIWVTQANVKRQGLAITPGLAFRYFSPVGPIQVNVGYNKYPPAPGQAFYLTGFTGQSQRNRPLLCVTNQGETPLLVTLQPDGTLHQDVASCPSAFAPAQRAGFFRHLNLTLSIGTDF